ncbi:MULTISPECIES: recombination regulator RecX [unclassified Enterococcus]|uniref:recombination regulator RecX n=1 Tax=unclassified Enterococcus TaxID=2608891 RepID=UPI001CE08DDA|nr:MULTISPECIES: recombination regulator RecX [unclassified Enterococcus]MCA5011540.1 recombination regulator RecX [Enterococcus sp. S23]MCA5015018.1 recombination regulator RecX [Enterococcus sp. S22(2020)]
METITKITKDKGQFYLVWLSSGEKLRVSEDTLVRQRLLKGQELTETMIEQIKKAGSYDVGLQLSLNYLSYQLRSKKEILDHLKEKEILPEDRKKIVARLEEMNLLDDKSFSESYVRTLMRTSDKGPKMIEQQLKRKGLSDEDIQHGLTFYAMEDQVEVAAAAAQKAMKRYRTKSFREALQKVQIHLMQKGFNREVIDLALEGLAFKRDEEQEIDAIKKEGDKLWEKHRKLDSYKRSMKVKQSLFQKQFDSELIQQYFDEKELEDEE